MICQQQFFNIFKKNETETNIIMSLSNEVDISTNILLIILS